MFYRERIGLALSGGGIRAAIFHLGVLKFLAQTDSLEQVRAVSTVSGASLCMSLLLSVSGYRWPTSEEYLQKVLPACERIILGHDIEKMILNWKKECPECDTVLLLAKALEQEWGVYGDLHGIPPALRWEINCATFETTENFRFSRAYMGDPTLGYAVNPAFPVSSAAAASGAYPELIGAYRLDMRPYQWYTDLWGRCLLPNPREICHLWDGGVYDNLGLEALYSPGYGLSKDIDFLIVSDVSAPIGEQKWSDFNSIQNLLRIWDISVKELNMLLVRNLFRDVVDKNNGAYLKTGVSAEDIARKCCMPPNIAAKLVASCMTPEEAEYVLNYPTTLMTPSLRDFYLILRHGYETALCVSHCKK